MANNEQADKTIYTATESYRDPLVQRLTERGQPLVVSRAHSAIVKFREDIERGHVIIKFTNTQGGTEMGVRLDNERTDLSQADFAQGQGTVHLEGNLTLNYVHVRCVADVDLATLEGQGHLEVLEWPAV